MAVDVLAWQCDEEVAGLDVARVDHRAPEGRSGACMARELRG
jgi:hypothetical protein